MRLKTKFQDEDFDLGEVVEANIYYGGDGRVKVIAKSAKGGMITFYFETLKGMNEMFEDATEEPKEYWFIDFNGEVKEFEVLGFEWQGWMKEIGNYFETEEEAKKAVEKLKAWKRLKDYHIKFKLDFVRNTIHFTYRIDGALHSAVNEERIIFEDMKTIFGGKNE